jgi:hypothetical protein
MRQFVGIRSNGRLLSGLPLDSLPAGENDGAHWVENADYAVCAIQAARANVLIGRIKALEHS